MTERPLLAIDTSVPIARVALVDAAGAVRASAETAAARHSANLLRLVDQVLGAAGLRVGELGAIACGGGPGSFTGLRVGLAVAKGLALPTGLPLVLVSSLEALARDLAAPAGALVVPCLDAGKGQVYARLHRAGASGLEPAGDEWLLEPGELVARVLAAAAPEIVLGGTGLDRHEALFRAALPPHALRPGAAGPTALSVAALALARLAAGQRDDIAGAVPSYGRPPDITSPKRPPPWRG